MKDHIEAVLKIIQKEFGVSPDIVERMTIGLANEVYLVSLADRSVIVRLNGYDKSFRGSDKYIPLFRSKGVSVPEILASDYSKKLVPYCYQIQSVIEGEDIDTVIADLSERRLQGIALKVGDVFKKLENIPTNGKFGYLYADEVDLFSSWTEYMKDMADTIRKRGGQSGVLDKELSLMLDKVMKKYTSYFDSVPSKFYYDDISSKNVMIRDGTFQGLVDLDGVTYGDYLEAVGRIKASWYGTPHGDFYSNAVMESLKLDDTEREIVTMYAFLNRMFWFCEAGVKFNENTSTEIDWDQVEEDKKVLELIMGELA